VKQEIKKKVYGLIENIIKRKNFDNVIMTDIPVFTKVIQYINLIKTNN